MVQQVVHSWVDSFEAYDFRNAKFDIVNERHEVSLIVWLSPNHEREAKKNHPKSSLRH